LFETNKRNLKEVFSEGNDQISYIPLYQYKKRITDFSYSSVQYSNKQSIYTEDEYKNIIKN
jgi:hypothetical protein